MRVNRTAGTAFAAIAALGGSFAAGIAVAGDGSPEPGSRRTLAAPVDQPFTFANADLTPAASCDELLDWYVERGLERVGPYGWDFPYYPMEMGMDDLAPGDMVLTAPANGDVRRNATAAAPAPDAATSSETGTNVQEAGVDEPDVVKTDGTVLVRIKDDDLVTYDVTGSRPELLESMDLPSIEGPELLLVADRVVVIGRDSNSQRLEGDSTRSIVVDVSDPAQPTITDSATYDSSLVTARVHGDTVRLVLDAGLPHLDFVEPKWLRDDASAREYNRSVVRHSTLDDWLPSVSINGEAQSLLGCDQVALPDDDSGLGTLAVVGFDPADPDTWSGAAVATESRLAYFSQDRMYLATSAWSDAWPCCWEGDVAVRPTVPATDGASHLYAFELSGIGAAHVASGEVDGAIADRWSMDEYDGVLRVAVGPTMSTGNFNSIVTLEEQGDDLVEIGRVDELGVSETIRSMRWFDDLAIMVTFRQVDPLYTVDLTDPTSPELLGQLKIPGFSEYLHPLGSDRLIGVGQDASPAGTTRGAQTALFDVSDLIDPRRLDVVTYDRDTTAGAGVDPRQFTWLPDRRTALTVIADFAGRTGWVSVLTVEDSRLENRMVEVEYGDEIGQVRTVPMPDGRVVLVTGDEVSFFDM